jgi:hypothetical protein
MIDTKMFELIRKLSHLNNQAKIINLISILDIRLWTIRKNDKINI